MCNWRSDVQSPKRQHAMPSKHITKVFQNHGTMIRCQVLEAAIDFGIATPAMADQEKELTEDVLNQVPRRPRSSQPIVRDTLLRYNGHNGPVINSYTIAGARLKLSTA